MVSILRLRSGVSLAQPTSRSMLEPCTNQTLEGKIVLHALHADSRMSWQGAMYRGQSQELTMDEEGGVTTIVHKQVRAAAIRPCQHLLCAPPVFLQGLSLPCEHCCCVAGHGCCSMVLQEAGTF